MRRLLIAAGWWLVSVAAASSAPSFDVLLAQVESRTIAASDIALARALRLFGFAPSTAPIERSDIERVVDVLLSVEEAGRIGLAAEEPDVERAWAEMTAHVGSEAALTQWLQTWAIDRNWVRRFVEAEVLRVRFFDARFAAFVFVTDDEVNRVLGPGQHDEARREQVRAQIIRETAEKAQAEWLVGARRRTSIRVLLPDGRSVDPPFPPPR